MNEVVSNILVKHTGKPLKTIQLIQIVIIS